MTEPNTPSNEPAAPPADAPAQPIQLPDDHPLVKTLASQKDEIKTLKAAAAERDTLAQQLAAVKNEGLPEWQQRINQLQEQFDAEKAAREQASQEAQAAETARLRMERATAKGLPTPLVGKLTGTTAEELDAEIDEIIPLLTPEGPRRPTPDPLLGRGGTPKPSTAEQFSAVMNGLIK